MSIPASALGQYIGYLFPAEHLPSRKQSASHSTSTDSVFVVVIQRAASFTFVGGFF
nr:hypothetical protein [Mycobacterium lepromatosis]